MDSLRSLRKTISIYTLFIQCRCEVLFFDTRDHRIHGITVFLLFSYRHHQILLHNLLSTGYHWLHFDKLDLWITKMGSFNSWSSFSGTYLRSMTFVTSVFFSKRCISYSLHIFWNQVVILSFLSFELLSRVVFMSLESSSVDLQFTGSIHIELSVWYDAHYIFDFLKYSLLFFWSFFRVLTSRMESLPSPIEFVLLIFAIRLLPFLSCPVYSLWSTRHMLIPSVDSLVFIADRFIIPVVLVQRKSSQVNSIFLWRISKSNNIRIRCILTLSCSCRLHSLCERCR